MRFLFWISIFLLSTTCCAQYKSHTFKEAQKTGDATLLVHYFEVPFFSQKKNETVVGINIDILEDFVKYVKTKKNVSILIKYDDNSSDFKAMYEGVKTGEGLVMGIGAIAGTEERKKEIGITRSYITFYNVLVSHNQIPNLEKMEDAPKVFKGLTGYTMKGSKMEDAMLSMKNKYYPSLTIKSLPSVSEYISHLISDKESVGYLMLPNYIEALKSNKSIKRHAAGDTEALPICFILPKKSDWLDVFNEFLSADGGYTNSPKFRSILTKHMGETGVKLLKIGG